MAGTGKLATMVFDKDGMLDPHSNAVQLKNIDSFPAKSIELHLAYLLNNISSEIGRGRWFGYEDSKYTANYYQTVVGSTRFVKPSIVFVDFTWSYRDQDVWRAKTDMQRLEASNGHVMGPFDEHSLCLPLRVYQNDSGVAGYSSKAFAIHPDDPCGIVIVHDLDSDSNHLYVAWLDDARKAFSTFDTRVSEGRWRTKDTIESKNVTYGESFEIYSDQHKGIQEAAKILQFGDQDDLNSVGKEFLRKSEVPTWKAAHSKLMALVYDKTKHEKWMTGEELQGMWVDKVDVFKPHDRVPIDYESDDGGQTS